MTTRLTRRDLLIAASCLPALRSGIARANGAGPLIRMPVDGGSLPLTGVDETGRPIGMIESSIDIVTAELGWSIEYPVVPWKRAQEVVMQGGLDALCTRPTPERSKLIRFASEPMFAFDSKWAHFAPDNPRADEIRQIKTIEDLKRFRIGLGLGNSWPNELMRGEGWQTTEVVSLKLVDGMVRAHHIDIYFECESISRYWWRVNHRAPLASIYLGFLPDGVIPYTFGLRKSFPDCEKLIADFDRAHRKMQASGAIDRALSPFTA